jgi:transcriptional regulator of acetoin/glycerol metabolism
MVDRQNLEKMNHAWEQFVNKGKMESIVRPLIASSWRRCREMGVNPFLIKGQEVIPHKELQEKLNRCRKLVTVSRPFMKTLYEIVAGSGFLVLLTDEDGVVLELTGDPEVIRLAEHSKVGLGANLSERIMGTSTLGTVLVERVPMQVVAREHYCMVFHEWTCSAAPIFNHKGRLLGVLNVSGHYERVHPHTLGMIVAAVKAIENELRLDETYQELRMAYEYSNTIMESIYDGLLSVDAQGRITHINSIARKILNYRDTEVNTTLDPCLSKLTEVLQKGQGFSNREILIDNNKAMGSFMMTAVPVKDTSGNIAGSVAILREIKAVHRFVANIVGANANYTFGDLVGKSARFTEAVYLAKQISSSDSTILLQGESGTGKDLFAQAIHNNSIRKKGPFIAVNCAAIPRELVGSELFGYEEGAFTGAKKGGYPGKFELANGGSIFLDEIGDMPLDLQVNFLRVLEEKCITRLGGHRIIPVDVRVIAATNKNLKELVKKGSFREDLYYRLNVLTIILPPLRDRGEDILLLAEHFIERLNKQLHKNITGMSAELKELFKKYSWPGNAREMQNLLERAMHLTVEGTLLLEHFPELSIGSTKRFWQENDRLETLSDFERQAILYALSKCKGNISEAAKMLDIARNTLYNKMNKLGINNAQKTNNVQ